MNSTIIFDIQHALRTNDSNLAFEILEHLPLPAPFDAEFALMQQTYITLPLHDKSFSIWSILAAFVHKMAQQYYKYDDLDTLGERFFYFGDYEMASIAWRNAYFSKDCPKDSLQLRIKIGLAKQKSTQIKYNFLLGILQPLREYVTEKQIELDYPITTADDRLERYLQNVQKTLAIHLDFIENPTAYPKIRLKMDRMPLSIAALTHLKSINLDEQCLTDYTFLCLLPHLVALSFRQSSSLDKAIDFSFLQDLPQLTHLDLSGNQLTDIHFLQYLTRLTHLNLGQTGFKSLGDWMILQQLPQLTHLNLNGNALQDLAPLQFLTNLKVLYLNDNAIEDITPLHYLTQLNELYLNNNQIKNVFKLYPLRQLTELELDNNPIEVFDLYLNHLSDFSDTGFKIRLLQQSRKRLKEYGEADKYAEYSDYDECFLDMPEILPLQLDSAIKQAQITGDLTLKGFKLTEIPPIFQMLSSLKCLDLTGIQIKKLDLPLHFSSLERLIAPVSWIKSDVLAQYTQLKHLDLSQAVLSDLSFLEAMPQLESLVLSERRLSTYDIAPLEKSKQLRSLTLKHYKKTGLEVLKHLTQLETLVLVGGYSDPKSYSFMNQLVRLKKLTLLRAVRAVSFIQKMPLLEELSIYGLTDFSWLRGLTHLKKLNIRLHPNDKKIKNWNELCFLPRLTTLDLSHCSISDIAMLPLLPNLESLNLAYNRIKDISALAKFTQLKTLNLFYNEIQNFNLDLSQFPNLETLNVSDNPILNLPKDSIDESSYTLLWWKTNQYWQQTHFTRS
jgi:internalin A